MSASQLLSNGSHSAQVGGTGLILKHIDANCSLAEKSGTPYRPSPRWSPTTPPERMGSDGTASWSPSTPTGTPLLGTVQELKLDLAVEETDTMTTSCKSLRKHEEKRVVDDAELWGLEAAAGTAQLSPVKCISGSGGGEFETWECRTLLNAHRDGDTLSDTPMPKGDANDGGGVMSKHGVARRILPFSSDEVAEEGQGGEHEEQHATVVGLLAVGDDVPWYPTVALGPQATKPPAAAIAVASESPRTLGVSLEEYLVEDYNDMLAYSDSSYTTTPSSESSGATEDMPLSPPVLRLPAGQLNDECETERGGRLVHTPLSECGGWQIDNPCVVERCLPYLDFRTLCQLLRVNKNIYAIATGDPFWKDLLYSFNLQPLLRTLSVTKDYYRFFLEEIITTGALHGHYTYVATTPGKSSSNAACGSPLDADCIFPFAELTLRLSSASLGQMYHPIGRAQIFTRFQDDSMEIMQGTCRFSPYRGCFSLCYNTLTTDLRGPVFTIAITQVLKQWPYEEAKHFETHRGGIRLVMTPVLLEGPNPGSQITEKDILAVSKAPSGREPSGKKSSNRMPRHCKGSARSVKAG